MEMQISVPPFSVLGESNPVPTDGPDGGRIYYEIVRTATAQAENE